MAELTVPNSNTTPLGAVLSMLGAKGLRVYDATLVVFVEGCRRGNKVRIALAGDLCNVELWKIRGASSELVDERHMVGVNQLHAALCEMMRL